MVPDMISAPFMAKDAGIISSVSDEQPENLGSPYWNLVSVDVTRVDGSMSRITGAVFGSTPHIVQVDHFKDLFAFKPEGNYILSFRNEDRPGAISEVLEILHNVNVNVASVNVARSQVEKEGELPTALCFMALDDDVPTNAMKALNSLSSLKKVAKIQLK